MTFLDIFIKNRTFGLLFIFTFSLGCSHFLSGNARLDADLTLKITLSADKYQPGQPVVARITLANAGSKALTTPMLDHTTVAFTVRPQLKGAIGDIKFVEPISSSMETGGDKVTLQPAGSTSSTVSRDFIFTVLSLERGGAMLEAVYSRPSPSALKPSPKTYAKAVVFTVEGDKAFAHRYLDGLLAREDAVRLAAARARGKVVSSDTLLITDEMGFYKWWINLTLEGAPGGNIKSYFVDPIFARVWKEARPFTAAEKGADRTVSPNATVLQRLKEQSMRKRTR